MMKVFYKGEMIELDDELEPGAKEFDTVDIEESKKMSLEDTIELCLDLDKTLDLTEELKNYDE